MLCTISPSLFANKKSSAFPAEYSDTAQILCRSDHQDSIAKALKMVDWFPLLQRWTALYLAFVCVYCMWKCRLHEYQQRYQVSSKLDNKVGRCRSNKCRCTVILKLCLCIVAMVQLCWLCFVLLSSPVHRWSAPARRPQAGFWEDVQSFPRRNQ